MTRTRITGAATAHSAGNGFHGYYSRLQSQQHSRQDFEGSTVPGGANRTEFISYLLCSHPGSPTPTTTREVGDRSSPT